MIRDERLTPNAAAQPIEELATPPPADVGPEDDSDNDYVESADNLDIQDILHLLDQVWPRNDPDQERMLRRFGRFSIKSELGRGGFGVVYLAEDPLLKRRVALKLPRIGIVSGTESWRRFLREAQAASRLDHPNLIPLLEAGTIGPVGFIGSAYVAGPSLEQWLRHNRRPVSPRWGAQIVAALAQAMEHAHQRKILHRDLKLANIVLYAPECDGDVSNSRAWENGNVASWLPRICDFGMAKLLEAEVDDTRSRIACGSPSYMAPEQAEARQSEIGPKTDVYGLGAILYRMLAGHPPFTGKSDLDTLRQVVGQEPASLRTLRPDLPRDLETICSKCLSKRPEGRYESALALAEDLEAYLEGRPIKARPMAIWARGWKWARRHPAVAALATAISLALVAGICGLLWHGAVLRDANHTIRGINERLTGANQQVREALDEKGRTMRQQRRLLAVHRMLSAARAIADEKLELAQRLLEEAEPELGAGANPVFAWSYLRRCVRDRLEVLRGHSADLSCFACSPDGRTLASGDERGEIRLWDLDTGRCRRVLSGPSQYLRRLVFSPDGKLLASSDFNEGTIVIWDVLSGRALTRLNDQKRSDKLWTLFFDADGHRLNARSVGLDSRSSSVLAGDVLPDGVGLPNGSHANPVLSAERAAERLQFMAKLLDGDAIPASLMRPVAQLSRHESDRGGTVATRDFALTVFDLGDESFIIHRTVDGTLLASGRFRPDGTVIVLFDPTAHDRKAVPGERASARAAGTRTGARSIKLGQPT